MSGNLTGTPCMIHMEGGHHGFLLPKRIKKLSGPPWPEGFHGDYGCLMRSLFLDLLKEPKKSKHIFPKDSTTSGFPT
jgi:hypothetical protein